MNGALTRRGFAAGALAGLALPIVDARADPPGGPRAGGGEGPLAIRPYQLMCLVCRLGAGEGGADGRLADGDLKNGDPEGGRLVALLAAMRADPARLLELRCNAEGVFRPQNPGHVDDTPEGALFNLKRDLDILQRLGLAPGDARPAHDLLARLLDKIPASRGICGDSDAAAGEWRGCPRAASGHYERGRGRGVRAIVPGRTAAAMAAAKKASVAELYRAATLRLRPHHLLCMACFHGGKAVLAPIAADNLFEAIDRVQREPDVPVTLIAGVCMICPPCPSYEAERKLCLGGLGMSLRDQKKDLDVLSRLGLKYGDTLPARRLFALLFERIASTREICGWGDGVARSAEWSVCGSARDDGPYGKARAAGLGIKS